MTAPAVRDRVGNRVHFVRFDHVDTTMAAHAGN